MKKLTLALAASVVMLSATQANISTGFYIGAAGGYGSTTAKETAQFNGQGVPGSVDIGGNAANIGIFGGYGWVQNCLYFGGEIGYFFENTKIRDTLDTNVPATGGAFELKRNGYFNAALRGGYLFTPNTMLYIRLGVNWGKWTLRDTLNAFSTTNAGSGSKNRMSFAPGLGLETAIHKNVYLRVEYTYEFGPSLRATNNAALSNNFVNVGTIRSQSGKIGLAYKF
ncbi:MAG: porin family protein [Alphaproteobacteria bacterium]|jgi:opacity protein-like surface antigen|nr:porin family protein [Alphaproteobacteria bacterium]